MRPDRDTRDVFGEYIELIYDLTQAVEDGATVPVYYESRLIELNLPEGVDPEEIDEQADEVTAGLDDSERERIQQRVAAMNAVYGAPDRVRKLSEDVVAHWETRSAEMRKFIGVPGKGMIVCATRDICADLYERIIAHKAGLAQRRHRQGQDQGRLHRRRRPTRRTSRSTSAARRRTRSSSSAPRTPTTSLSCSSSSRCC